MNQRGSLAILVSGYLSLLLLLFISGFSYALGLIAQNRIQGITDAAILYAHDRAATKGIPDPQKLASAVSSFLTSAPSALQIDIRTVETEVSGTVSKLALCASHQDPMGWFKFGVICKTAQAESFLVD